MNRKEFIKYIESIGFKTFGFYYYYKQYRIDLYKYKYEFYNGSEWIYYIKLDDLTPLKKIERSYKLKKILG